MFSIRRANNGVWFGAFAKLDQHNIKHGISTRFGGLSRSPFASLNLGLKTGDELETVRRNRELFCQAVGVPFASMVSAQQVHAVNIHVVQQDDAGKGSLDSDEAIEATDALITVEKNIPLMLFFADCVPVLICDPKIKAVGVSHAGWKGTVGKIAQKTIQKMQDEFGTKPADCVVGIGPSIGPERYEVDEVVINELRQSFSWWEEVVQPSGERWLLDLWQTNRRQMLDIGVESGNIEISNVCTLSNMPMFYSHRGEKGMAGRQGAVIML